MRREIIRKLSVREINDGFFKVVANIFEKI